MRVKIEFDADSPPFVEGFGIEVAKVMQQALEAIIVGRDKVPAFSDAPDVAVVLRGSEGNRPVGTVTLTFREQEMAAERVRVKRAARVAEMNRRNA